MRPLPIVFSRPLLWLVAALIGAVPASARELHAPIQDMIAVELFTVDVISSTGTPVVLLREPGSGDTIPLIIGPSEARAILMALHGIETSRPMTHELISSILSATGTRLQRVLIDDLVEGTYIGALELRTAASENPLYVDARPSDSLAMAIRENAAIFIAPAILDAIRHRIDDPLDDDQLVTTFGMSVATVTEALRERLALGDRNGVLVRRSAGAAAAAGIPPGALITAINGATPASAADFIALMDGAQREADIHIVYWIEGREYTATLSREADKAERIQRVQPKLQV